MKTTKIAASLLSLSLIVPGLTVSFSVPTKAQNNQLLCPRGDTDYQIKERLELRDIAKHFTGIQNNWREIGNPATGRTFSEEEAKRLTPGDTVCIPSIWLLPRR
jgi:hypothetical protein